MTVTHEDPMAQAFQEQAAQKTKARAEKDALIAKLWAEGESASVIAERLGTRAEVIRARVKKLGLRRRR